MAKDVNLLDDDKGEGRTREEPEGPKGGGTLKWVLIGLVAVGLVGGSAGAAYYLWWQPRQREKLATQKRAEEVQKRQLEEARREAERRERELEALRRVREMAAAPAIPGQPQPPGAPAPGTPRPGAPLIVPISPEERREAARAEPRRGEELVSREVRPPAAPAPGAPPPRPPERAARPAQPRPPAVARAPSPPAPRRDAAPPSGAYTVRVAACVTQACVQAVQKKMKDKGISTHLGQGRGRFPLLDVVAGDFSNRQEAERLAGEVRRKGLKANILSLGDSRFRVSLGAFLMAEDAHIQLDRLEAAGFSGKIETRQGFAPMREVRVGRYATRAEALEESRKLGRQGIPSVVVRR